MLCRLCMNLKAMHASNKWKQIATNTTNEYPLRLLCITSSSYPLFHKETGVGAFAGHFEAKLFIGPNGWSICLLHLQTKIGATVKMHAKFPIISWDEKTAVNDRKKHLPYIIEWCWIILADFIVKNYGQQQILICQNMWF